LKKDRFFGETAFVMLQTETGGGGFLCICVCTYKYFFRKIRIWGSKTGLFYRKCSRFVFFMMWRFCDAPCAIIELQKGEPPPPWNEKYGSRAAGTAHKKFSDL
jgi:hypothetical protein